MCQSSSQRITARLVLTEMNLTHNVLIADIFYQVAVILAVFVESFIYL
jgi:hypothetical protein